MPAAIVWALGAAGGAALVRWVVREARRINRELDKVRMTEAAETVRESLPRLRFDPQSGLWRPE